MASDLDYERIARDAEAAPPPEVERMMDDVGGVAPEEKQTRGPVIIDTVTKTVRSAESGEELFSFQAPEEKPERTLDIALAAFCLLFVAGAVVIAAILVSGTFDVSQKLALIGLDIALVGERLWREIHRYNDVPATAEEGIIHVSEQDRIERYSGNYTDARGE